MDTDGDGELQPQKNTLASPTRWFRARWFLMNCARGEHPQKAEKIALLQSIPLLDVTLDVLEIVEVYIAHKLMPGDRSGDALHLALASRHNCDILLTWNCVHLANANKVRHIQRVNALLGLSSPVLATPLQLMEAPDDSGTGN